MTTTTRTMIAAFVMVVVLCTLFLCVSVLVYVKPSLLSSAPASMTAITAMLEDLMSAEQAGPNVVDPGPVHDHARQLELIQASLSRPLCLVVTMGSDVVLPGRDDDDATQQHEQQQQQQQQQQRSCDTAQCHVLRDHCVVHIASNDVAVWPPPPPHSFVYHRFYLVSDAFDAVAPLLRAAQRVLPLGKVHDGTDGIAAPTPTPAPYRRPPPDAGLRALVPRQPLRATTFFRSLERNRVAAVIIRPRSHEDVAALLDVLDRFQNSGRDNEGFLETVLVQQCGGDHPRLARSLIGGLVGEHSYTVVEEKPQQFNGFNSLGCNVTTLFIGSASVRPSAYPKWPTRYTTLSEYGRLTNQFFEDATVIAQLGRHPALAYIVPERYLHEGGATTLYDHEWIRGRYGVRNQLLSLVDLAVNDRVAWCIGNSSTRTIHRTPLKGEGRQGSTSLEECYGADNLVPIGQPCHSNNAASHDLRLTRLPSSARSRRWDPKGVKAITPKVICGSDNSTLAALNDTASRPSSALSGLAFYRQFVKSGWTLAETYQPPLSPIFHELADRQLAVYQQRLRAHWNLTAADVEVNIVGVHMRLGDYDYASTMKNWTEAVSNAAKFLADKTNRPVHGLIVCTDDATSPKYQAVMDLLPDTPKFECLADLSFDQGNFGYLVGTIQTVLSQTSCFIGLSASTFTHRINSRRVLEGWGEPRCDILVGNTPMVKGLF